MILLFEGPDYSGKDTLIAKMRQKDNVIYFHNGTYSSQAHAMKAYRQQIKTVHRILEHTFSDVQIIFNRAHISSWIYGQIIRNEIILDEEYFDIDNEFAALNTQVIKCLPPKEICMRGWENRIHEEYVKDLDLMEQVYDFYANDFELTTNLPYVTYDFTKEKDYVN